MPGRPAADPDQPRAGLRHPRRVGERLADVPAHGAQLLARRRLAARQEALGHPHGAERPRPEPACVAVLHRDELHRPAAEVEHRAVAQRRRVDGGQVAVARLLFSRQDSYRQRGSLRELGAVGRVADRRRGDRHHLVDRGRAAEVVEDRGDRPAALHPVERQRAGLRQPGADADRLEDLVGSLPPPVLGGEDDEAKRVRAEVGDGGARHGRRMLARRSAGVAGCRRSAT